LDRTPRAARAAPAGVGPQGLTTADGRGRTHTHTAGPRLSVSWTLPLPVPSTAHFSSLSVSRPSAEPIHSCTGGRVGARQVLVQRHGQQAGRHGWEAGRLPSLAKTRNTKLPASDFFFLAVVRDLPVTPPSKASPLRAGSAPESHVTTRYRRARQRLFPTTCSQSLACAMIWRLLRPRRQTRQRDHGTQARAIKNPPRGIVFIALRVCCAGAPARGVQPVGGFSAL
jgi:hypothetical protein